MREISEVEQVSFEGYRSAAEWARGVPATSVFSLRDVEAAIAHFRPYEAAANGLRVPKRRGIVAVEGWLGSALIMLAIALPLVGPVMYMDGSFNTRNGVGHLEFNPDRASLLVPLIYGFLSIVIAWSGVGWVRNRRLRAPMEAPLAIYVGGSALLALRIADVVGIGIRFGENVESTIMWICAALALVASVAYVTCSRTAHLGRKERGRHNFGFELRAERREVAMILKERGLLNEPDLEAALAKPIGFHLREDGSVGLGM